MEYRARGKKHGVWLRPPVADRRSPRRDGVGLPPAVPPVNPVGPFTVQIVDLRSTDADVLIDWTTVPDATSYHVYPPGFAGPPLPFDDMIPHPTRQHTVTVQRQATDWDLAVRVTPWNGAGAGQRTIEVITIPRL